MLEGVKGMASKRKRRLIDLSLPLMNNSMEPAAFVPEIKYMPPAAAARQMARQFDISLDSFPEGVGLAQEWVSLSIHSGTHVDAPSHYGPRADGKPPRTIEHVPLDWCYGDGVVLDFSTLGPQDLIDSVRIQDALRAIDHEIQAGEIVLLRTDTDKRFYQPDFEYANPGLSRDGCEFLVDRGVHAIGIDAGSMDAPVSVMIERLKSTGDKAQFFQAHFFGREREYLQIEKLTNLEKLPPTGFQVFFFPVLVQGAGGGWTRAVAILEE
jgi:kynurenine formamidase